MGLGVKLCNCKKTFCSGLAELSFRFHPEMLPFPTPRTDDPKNAGRPSAQCDFLHLGLALLGRGAVFHVAQLNLGSF